MKYARSITILMLCLGAITVLIITHNWPQPVPARSGLIDQRLLRTATYVAETAATTDETDFAEQTVRDADRELDLAFVQALREADRDPVAINPESAAIKKRLLEAQRRLQADQEQLAKLAPKSEPGSEPQSAEIFRAQIELDEDEMADMQHDLSRAEGDVGSRLQVLLDQHQHAEQHHLKAGMVGAAANSAEAGYRARNLIDQLSAWYALRSNDKFPG